MCRGVFELYVCTAAVPEIVALKGSGTTEILYWRLLPAKRKMELALNLAACRKQHAERFAARERALSERGSTERPAGIFLKEVIGGCDAAGGFLPSRRPVYRDLSGKQLRCIVSGVKSRTDYFSSNPCVQHRRCCSWGCGQKTVKTGESPASDQRYDAHLKKPLINALRSRPNTISRAPNEFRLTEHISVSPPPSPSFAPSI